MVKRIRNLPSRLLPIAAAALAVMFGNLSASRAQLLSSWTAPTIDDGNPIPNPVNSWLTDVTTGESTNLLDVSAARALAADNASGRVYASSGSRLTTYTADQSGDLTRAGESIRIQVRAANGTLTDSGPVSSMGFARGVIYAFISGSAAGLYTINPSTAVATLVRPASPTFPLLAGIDYNPLDGLMYGIRGPNTAATIVRFDLDTFTLTTVADVPESAYGGFIFSFDGVAVGNGRVYLTGNRTSSTPIPVFNLTSGAFEPNITGPRRFSENSFYPSGATFVAPQDLQPPQGPEVFFTFRNNASVPGVGTAADEDVVAYEVQSGQWSRVLDGSEVGLGPLEISGLAVLDGGAMLLSFTAPATIPGLVGGPDGEVVDDSDIVRFVPTAPGASSGSFEFFFDGSDVGLTANGEDIDAISIARDGRLIISTIGRFRGTGADGADEDLMAFTGSLGADTAGSFELLFDGSDVGLGGNGALDVDAAALTELGTVLLSILQDGTVAGFPTGDEDILEFNFSSSGALTTGDFSSFLDLSAIGISASEDVGSLSFRAGPPSVPACGNLICEAEESTCSCPSDCGAPPAEACGNGVDDDCDGNADCDDSACSAEPLCADVTPVSLTCDDLVRFDSARCFAGNVVFVVSTQVAGTVQIDVNGSRSIYSVDAGTNVLQVSPLSSGPTTVAITNPTGCFQPLTATCQ